MPDQLTYDQQRYFGRTFDFVYFDAPQLAETLPGEALVASEFTVDELTAQESAE